MAADHTQETLQAVYSASEEVVKNYEAALAKAAADLATKDAQLAKMAADRQSFLEAIPAAVESLVEHERLLPERREKAAAAIAENPASALQLLTKVADIRVGIPGRQVSAVGKPVSDEPAVKSASVQNSKKASDSSYEQRVRNLGQAMGR